MPAKILILDAHPDPAAQRFGHALAEAYAAGARGAGHEVRMLRLAELDVPLLRTASEFGVPLDDGPLREAQRALEWAEHVVIVFPLWLGTMPALLKAFLEQISRGGFVAEADRRGWRPHLRGRSARLIVTMGMPAPVYRIIFGAHGVMGLKRSILNFAGISPVRITLFGAVGAGGEQSGKARLNQVTALGRAGR